MDDAISRTATAAFLYNMGLEYAASVIEDPKRFHSVHASDRKVGEWIKMSDSYGVYWVCSECGFDLPRIEHFDPQFDLFPRLESIPKAKYCPDCGARMKGGE
ncbi:MAG: hypothetical protein IJL43_00450 [Lachnospiraceae bacterium]|nr:hypothetical protein [Lachnospiraceae bacterium]